MLPKIIKAKCRKILLSSINVAGQVAQIMGLENLSAVVEEMNHIIIGSTLFKIENHQTVKSSARLAP